MQRGIIMNSKELSEALYHDAGLETIDISWETVLVDGHGNESIGRIMLVNLTPEDANKINWDNITTDQFEDLALSWKHPNVFN